MNVVVVKEGTRSHKSRMFMSISPRTCTCRHAHVRLANPNILHSGADFFHFLHRSLGKKFKREKEESKRGGKKGKGIKVGKGRKRENICMFEKSLDKVHRVHN